MKESRKFETEFEEFQQKNAQQKEEWIKANPEKAKAMRQAEGEDWGDDWEDDSIRELKQIFQVKILKKYLETNSIISYIAYNIYENS